MVNIDPLLGRVSKAARYTGGEWNSIVKDWTGTTVRMALAYPDVYDIGMSNMGLQILYDILNRETDVVAERVYAPWPDMEAEMRKEQIPLWSLETRRPLSEFDAIGFSLSYEMTYTNVINMLDLAGIPVFTEQRGEHDPLIIAGGSGALEPEPMAPFIDAFALGEGEEIVLDLAQCIRHWKAAGGGPRRELLRRVATIDGMYVPSLYDVRYGEGGGIRTIEPNDSAAPSRIRRRVSQFLPPVVTKPIVPYLQTVHDRAAIEIQRGCTQGCRFCQAGMIYRPVRERPKDEVIAAARELLANTGYDELSLMSLSTTDHVEIADIVEMLMDEFGDRGLRISLPSTRVDTFSVRVAEAVARGRKHNITLAPEAGSQRMRDVINKLVTEEDLLGACENAFKNGWTGVKMYFMVGLPTETDEDVQGIVDVAAKVKAIGKSHIGGRARVRVSTSNFIPKPHTPFQWCAQATAAELEPRHNLLRIGCKRAGVEFTWNDPKESMLEAILSRGDRRLAGAIHRAWQLGARFDAWGEYHDWRIWEQSLAEHELDAAWYANRPRDLWETLPWDHIESGVTTAYLRGEWQNTLNQVRTLDCHRQPCNVCGMQNLPAEQCAVKLDELKVSRRAAKSDLVIPLVPV